MERMVGKLSIYVYIRVWSDFRANLVVRRLLRSYFWRFIQLLRCGEVETSIWLSQFSVRVLDGGMLRRTKVIISHEVCRKRRSFPVDLRLQYDEITQLLLQGRDNGKPSLCPKS